MKKTLSLSIANELKKIMVFDGFEWCSKTYLRRKQTIKRELLNSLQESDDVGE